ncbi:hypothetical protein HXA31_18335 [Salipaludibacillus agaradhaerens]|uniref:hypothetical protein n=1 Tax=Salipaludibacillus agaradhaerens TaxID=76935 RepID=UPI002151B1AF|nr:hypothetical protein [Salipaludibacillus agaradhaerens]MCR6116297.1 hypothetical protein [Salipaludibacillus agaradhaerens]
MIDTTKSTQKMKKVLGGYGQRSYHLKKDYHSLKMTPITSNVIGAIYNLYIRRYVHWTFNL